MKIFLKNKIDSEKLTQKVRDVIKIADWQKQDMREGFKESFSPLIESQESIKKSIDEQQNATLEQLKKNQLALTEKENKLEQLTSAMLAIMDSDDGASGSKDDGASGSKDDGASGSKDDDDDDDVDYFDAKSYPTPEKKIKTITPDYFDKYLNNKETQETLKKYNVENLPSSYYYKDKLFIYKKVENIAEKMNSIKRNNLQNIADINITTEGYYLAEPRNLNPRKKTLELIKDYNELSKYFYQLDQLYKFKIKMEGKGINNYKSPSQLLDRLELLGGSILAGNNGVINEFSQIAHLLAQMSVITKRQLNNLLKTYITNR